ncbi:hypothetical protein WH7805_01657 [Synechococcus sp. WH 7805]|jgi:hypothetical protein|nr:hypothetical protein WH7805_01657 [Synechococcus sp. WH 7805]
MLPCKIFELSIDQCLKFDFNWSGLMGKPVRYIHHQR